MQKKENPKSKAELLAEYTDPAWRARYLEISDVRDLLRGCILNRGYSIPDSLNNAVHLSDAGSRLSQALHTKHKVPVKEAKTLCLLHLAYIEPLVDFERTDPRQLRDSLHEQILSGKILLPHAYGRLLYDKGATLFKTETPQLSFEETIELLDRTPIGFTQLGVWTTGPFGIVESLHSRWVPPRRRIPFYHCASSACTQVHTAALETNHSAAVNRFGDEFSRTVRAIADHPSEWALFEAELTKPQRQLYDDRSQLGTHWLVGDCFSAHELRTLLRFLLDEAACKAQIRARLETIGLSGSSEAITEGQGPAELMQLVMLASDESIVNAIDRLVASGAIHVPEDEIRQPVINAGYGTGHFGLVPELSSHGVRFVGGYEDLAPLRLKRLIRRLYPSDGSGDIIEFEWQLRGADAPTSTGKLEQFIRSNTPAEVVQRLVLATRANVITACAELNLDQDNYLDDGSFVRKLLWKLGYPAQSLEDFNAGFWRFHDEMGRLAQTAGISAVVDEAAVRSLASNFFVELEGVLDDALAFTTWLVAVDHMSDVDPFTYRVDRDRLGAFELLNIVAAGHGTENGGVEYSDRNELYPLCRGFAILADHLEELARDPSSRIRPLDELPLGVHGSDLKIYPFLHRELFLDLTDSARQALLELLRGTSRRLASADVPSVRNSWQHYRRSSVPLEPLVACLQAVAGVVSSLEGAGLCRIMYSHTGVSFDGWGRGFFTFEDRRGRAISIAAPSALDISALPSAVMPQYLVTSAVLSDSGDFVRCRPELASEFSREWTDFQVRRHERKAEDIEDVDSGPSDGFDSAM